MDSSNSSPFIFFLLFNLFFIAAKSTTCHFPAIFNFGDSNSDTGGLSAVFGQAPPPHGESFFHHPAGRYCDGRLIVDFIANNLSLPYLSAYLDSIGSNFKHGANFATAGSTIRPQNTTLRQSGFSPISFDVQWNQFFDFHTRSQIVRERGGIYKELLPKAEDFGHALYTFDIGQNDITSGYFMGLSSDQVRAYIPQVLNEFKNVISYIYGQGGRNFWIHNTGPFGCLPYVLERIPLSKAEIDEAGCGIPLNEVAQFYNHGLRRIADQLRRELPKSAITYVDVYSVKYNLISQARKHGFNESVRACCGHGGKYNYNINIGCGGIITMNGRQVMVGKPCQDPSIWINWDGVHYTQAANQWIFQQIVNGSFSSPPISLNMACHRKIIN
ncbi:GDSL-like Lipase/Acylhydrolase superfamily protein [Euphorbia peplus]|nr:GDSL-like Lipase/Acylhydrolase superfamily protein [Euphorbia peplus]